jgi:hypothetical protein
MKQIKRSSKHGVNPNTLYCEKEMCGRTKEELPRFSSALSFWELKNFKCFKYIPN